MSSIADGAVNIQTSAVSVPSTPSWFGEVMLLITHLKKQGVFAKLCERVQFPRRHFDRYDVIDFFAVLFGYAISGERTLEAFSERLQPFALPFMTLFDRDQLPSRLALSRFLAALTEAPVNTLRTLFLDDLLCRPARQANYKVRSFLGWSRHIILVLLACAFLVGVTVQQRPPSSRQIFPMTYIKCWSSHCKLALAISSLF